MLLSTKLQFKVVHRIHYSKAKIAKIYPGNADEGCNRCSPFSFDQYFLVMPQTVQLLVIQFDTILKVMGLNIFPSPHKAIFCRPPDELKRTATKVNVNCPCHCHLKFGCVTIYCS